MTVMLTLTGMERSEVLRTQIVNWRSFSNTVMDGRSKSTMMSVRKTMKDK